jgi:hypothetical protein
MQSVVVRNKQHIPETIEDVVNAGKSIFIFARRDHSAALILHFGIFMLQLCVPLLSHYLRSVICILCSGGREFKYRYLEQIWKECEFR